MISGSGADAEWSVDVSGKCGDVYLWGDAVVKYVGEYSGAGCSEAAGDSASGSAAGVANSDAYVVDESDVGSVGASGSEASYSAGACDGVAGVAELGKVSCTEALYAEARTDNSETRYDGHLLLKLTPELVKLH